MGKCILAVMLLGSLAYASGDREYVQRSDSIYPLAEHGRLVVRNEIGDVHIRTTDRKDVKVTAIKKASGAGDAEGPARVQEIRVNVTTSGHEVRVSGKLPDRPMHRFLRGDGGLQLSFEIEVPRNANIDVENNIGDVNVDAATADISVKQNIGNVNVDFDGGFHPRSVSLNTNIGNVNTNLTGSTRGWLGKKFTALLNGEHSVSVKLNIGDINVHTKQ